MSTPLSTVRSRVARPGEMAAAFSPDPQRAYKDVTIRQAIVSDNPYPAFGSPVTALSALGQQAEPMNAAKLSKYVGWGAAAVWGGVLLLGGFFVWRLVKR